LHEETEGTKEQQTIFLWSVPGAFRLVTTTKEQQTKTQPFFFPSGLADSH